MKYIVKAAIAVACVGLAWAAAVRIESPVESGRAASPASGVAVASAPPRAGHANAATAAASPAGDYYLSPYTQFHPIEEIDPNTHLAVEFQSVAIGDVTGDGRDDVVANTLTPSHRVYVFPQRANGLDMEHPLRFDHGSHVYLAGTELLLGDLNEDGVLDVLGATSNDSGALGTLHVLLSNGQGGLTQTFIPTSLERWFNAFLVDVDLDGHLDFIAHMSWRDDFNPACGTACTARRTFFGDGKGGFPRSTFEIMPKAAGPVLTRAGDLNGDGIPDLVTAGPEGYTSDEWTLQVTYHDTIGGYAPAVPLTEALWENDFGDFNHDGRTDLLTGQQRYGLYVRTQLVDGQFELPVFLPSGFMMNPGQLVADLDRDGADDVVSAMFDEPQTPVRLRIFLQRNGALTLSVPPSGLFEPTSGNYSGTLRPLAAGDINGDGCTDIVNAAGPDGLTFFLGNNCRPARTTHNDFDGDHASDLFWHRADNGTSDLWKRASLAQRQVIPSINTVVWRLTTTGDFDGDGRTDLLWRNRNTGANVIWRAGNARTTNVLLTIADPAWKVMGSGDFNGDGRSDLLWRHQTNGANVAWLSGNANTPMAMRAITDQNWKPVAIGDYDGDGKDDVHWRHFITGANVVWRSADASTPIPTQSVALAWVVQGAGDFDGDGKADMLWRNTSSGANVIWKSGNAATARSIPTLADLGWQVAAIGDYDNDGKSDIAWRHASAGTNVVWLAADGARQRMVKPVDPAWSVLP